MGAGLLLQPSGLAVFEHLGVLEHALSLTRIVTGLEGQLANGKLLVILKVIVPSVTLSLQT